MADEQLAHRRKRHNIIPTIETNWKSHTANTLALVVSYRAILQQQPGPEAPSRRSGAEEERQV